MTLIISSYVSNIQSMNFKTIFLILVIITYAICNYMILVEYSHEYNPANFSIQKLLDKRYRCIVYFHNNEYDRYTDTRCKAYRALYLVFMTEKILYMYMYFAYNLIMVSLIVIFQIML